MDGDDGPCHAASFGIPAYMIAYLESLIHLLDSLILPKTSQITCDIDRRTIRNTSQPTYPGFICHSNQRGANRVSLPFNSSSIVYRT
jgi:hypothetical protein